MSLILDALRKSEAERRRGQAPDLFAPVATKIAPVSKQPVAVIGVALAAMLAAIAIVFWPQQPSPKAVSADSAEIAATPAQDNVVPMATAPIATSTTIPVPRPPPAPPLEMPRKPVATQPAKSNPPAEVSGTPIDRPPAVDNDSAAAPDPDVTDASDNEPALPSLATLDSTTRATLPPLQLSMHVWNPDATRRFAIIDGQRLGEGGKLAGAVVAEIRRDGVVLDIGGRQFLLPRP